MPELLKNTVSVRDFIYLTTFIVVFVVQWTTTSKDVEHIQKNVAQMKDDFNSRVEQGDKALELLHSMDVTIKTHIAAGHDD